MNERDNSIRAIDERYMRASEFAIVTMNSICFDSLRDIAYLLKINKDQEEKIAKLEKENKELQELFEKDMKS